MNEKEIAEIRRCYHPEKSNITNIRGCYVNENGEIISEINQSLFLMPQEESEKMLALLKRTLSGTLGKNLVDIEFSTQQVVDSDEHRLLMALRDSSLGDADAVMSFYRRVIQSIKLEGNYMILLAHDTYDIPYRSKDGARLEDAASAEVFSYILCTICPVKTTKPALGYFVTENEFHTCKTDWIVAPPEFGFMFPAFDDRSANLYSALFYSRDIAENHEGFVDAVFKSDMPMPAAAQKETFEALLADTLAEECSYEVVQAVHGQLCALIEEHKANKEEDPLTVNKDTVKQVLQTCGVCESHVLAFDEQYDAAFGEDADISPRNIVDPKQFEVRTPDVTIRVNPERRDLIQTRTIDGIDYLLIRIEDGVEVNGVNVHFAGIGLPV